MRYLVFDPDGTLQARVKQLTVALLLAQEFGAASDVRLGLAKRYAIWREGEADLHLSRRVLLVLEREQKLLGAAHADKSS